MPSGGGEGLRREDLAVSWLPAEELEPRKVWGASLSPGSPTCLKCVVKSLPLSDTGLSEALAPPWCVSSLENGGGGDLCTRSLGSCMALCS